MPLYYPRCCVLAVQQRRLMACLRQQEVDSPVRKEVRTFDPTPSDMVVLADWLACQRVTHVAIERTGWAWESLYDGLRQAFTVLLFDAATSTDSKDVQRMADLLAYGLVQGHMPPPGPPSAPPRPYRLRRLPVVGALLIMPVTAYGVWWYAGHVATERPPTSPPPQAVRWQPQQVSYQIPVGEPFALPLPALERQPAGVPVDAALEAADDAPGWLQLDRESLHIYGVAPPTAEGQTYRLSIRAHAGQGSDSRLVVVLTITGQPARSTPPTPLPGHWTW